MINAVLIAALAAVLGFDVWLWRTGRPTISEAYQALFPTTVDILISVPVAAGICFLPAWLGVKAALLYLAGHVFFPNKERHR